MCLVVLCHTAAQFKNEVPRANSRTGYTKKNKTKNLSHFAKNLENLFTTSPIRKSIRKHWVAVAKSKSPISSFHISPPLRGCVGASTLSSCVLQACFPWLPNQFPSCGLSWFLFASLPWPAVGTCCSMASGRNRNSFRNCVCHYTQETRKTHVCLSLQSTDLP